MKTNGGFLVTKIKQLGDRIFEKILSEKNIDAFNGAQGRILYVLWQKDGISIRSLSTKCGLAITSLTTMLERMENQGLISRVQSETDKRKTLLFLTEKAHALKGEYDSVSDEMGSIYYKGFQRKKLPGLRNASTASERILRSGRSHEYLYQRSDSEHESRHRLHSGVYILLCPQQRETLAYD